MKVLLADTGREGSDAQEVKSIAYGEGVRKQTLPRKDGQSHLEGKPRLQKDKYAYCRQTGHWKKECSRDVKGRIKGVGDKRTA